MKKKSDLFKIGALSLLLSAGSTVSVWGNDFLQDVKLSIQQKNVSISKVLDDIEQKTGYSILVRDSDIDTSKKSHGKPEGHGPEPYSGYDLCRHECKMRCRQ